jgi:hypothetical protein
MGWHPGSLPEWPAACRRWKPPAPAHVAAMGTVRETGARSHAGGRSHDSARVVGPPASILDSRTGVKVTFISAKPCPSQVRLRQPPCSTGCDRARARDCGGIRPVLDLEAARVPPWIASSPASGSAHGVDGPRRSVAGESGGPMIRVVKPRMGEAETPWRRVSKHAGTRSVCRHRIL